MRETNWRQNIGAWLVEASSELDSESQNGTPINVISTSREASGPFGIPRIDHFSTDYLRSKTVAGEYNAQIENFVSTVVVNHPRLGRVKMNTSDYNAEKDGPIIEGPTERQNTAGLPPKPLKNPRINEHGDPIAEQNAPTNLP